MLDTMAHRFARSRGYVGRELKPKCPNVNVFSGMDYEIVCGRTFYLSIKRNSKSGQNLGLRESLWTGYLAEKNHKHDTQDTVGADIPELLIINPKVPYINNCLIIEDNVYLVLSRKYEPESKEWSVLLMRANSNIREIDGNKDGYEIDRNGNRKRAERKYVEGADGVFPCYLEIENYRMRDFEEGRDNATKYTVVVSNRMSGELNDTINVFTGREYEDFTVSSVDYASFDRYKIMQLTKSKRN